VIPSARTVQTLTERSVVPCVTGATHKTRLWLCAPVAALLAPTAVLTLAMQGHRAFSFPTATDWLCHCNDAKTYSSLEQRSQLSWKMDASNLRALTSALAGVSGQDLVM